MWWGEIQPIGSSTMQAMAEKKIKDNELFFGCRWQRKYPGSGAYCHGSITETYSASLVWSESTSEEKNCVEELRESTQEWALKIYVEEMQDSCCQVSISKFWKYC
jgi:hypothetical protein